MTTIQAEISLFEPTNDITISMHGTNFLLSDFKLEGYLKCEQSICLPSGYQSSNLIIEDLSQGNYGGYHYKDDGLEVETYDCVETYLGRIGKSREVSKTYNLSESVSIIGFTIDLM